MVVIAEKAKNGAEAPLQCPQCGGQMSCPECGASSALQPLTRDLRKAAANLSDAEARFLVDTYYQRQEDRIERGNQIQSVSGMKAVDIKRWGWHTAEMCVSEQCSHTGEAGKVYEPHEVMLWLWENEYALEKHMASVLGSYSASRPLGQWARSIVGIGPIIAAGLMAHIDVTGRPTAGHIWRFAGLEDGVIWLGASETAAALRRLLDGRSLDASVFPEIERHFGRSDGFIRRHVNGSKPTMELVSKALARRPWNTRLKTLCWKIGESFVKVKGRDSDIYGKMYEERRLYEDARNERGDNAEEAARVLTSKNFGRDTESYKAYTDGKLPKAQIYARAKRYAVKIFLAHYHHVAYELQYGEPPPKPYAIEHLGHAHYMAPPNWK